MFSRAQSEASISVRFLMVQRYSAPVPLDLVPIVKMSFMFL